MMSSRTAPAFLSGGLAAAAVSAGLLLAAPAHADTGGTSDGRPCSSPAVAAVYSTRVTDPVFGTVPAVTHAEWRWQRDVPVEEDEYLRVLAPAYDESDWSREVPGPPEHRYQRTVVDSPAVPAVPATPEVGHHETVVITPAVTVAEDEYVHGVTGNTRWESPDWGAQNGTQNGNGDGWSKTGAHREREVTAAVTEQHWVVDEPATPGTPAVPESSHVESVWAAAAPGPSWAGPLESRPGATVTETETTGGDAPEGNGWVLLDARHVEAVTETAWSAAVLDGWTPTGVSRSAGSTHEETAETSASAPDGDGWTAVEGSELVVVDSPEHQELLSPGSVDQVLVSPALPATAPCPAGPTDPAGATDPGGSQAAGPQAAPAADETVAPTNAAVLPDTGGVPGWLAPAGLASIAAGALLVRAARRRAI